MDIEQYKETLLEDGVVHIKSLLNKDEIEELAEAIRSNQDSPGPFGKVMEANEGRGKFFMDFNNWIRLPKIKAFCTKPKLVDLVTKLTGSKNCWLFHDHVLVKSGESLATPWHQDRPYYIFKGDLNLSVWMTADDVPNSSSLIFVRGSHKEKKMYMPKAFADGKDIALSEEYETMSDKVLPKDRMIDFDMKAGDALIFFNSTIHSSHSHKNDKARRALSVRYLLDGAALTKRYINATPPFDRMGVEVIEDGEVPNNFLRLKG